MDSAVASIATPAAANGSAAAVAATVGEIRTLKRAFIRKLKIKGRPDAHISALISNACLATVIARQALADIHVNATDKVRLCGMANRPRRELQAAVASQPEPALPNPIGRMLRNGKARR